MANYVVGDIQGCCQPLLTLLNDINFNPQKDTLWPVGDLIGRGLEPLETLKLLISLGDSCKPVLGNHDLHFLAVAAGIKEDKPANAFSDLLQHKNLSSFVDWIRHKPLASMITKDIAVVHAGLYPNWSLKKLIKYSQKVENVLQSESWQHLLSIMYSDMPEHWDKAISKDEKLRFIINACTRMRYIDAEGALELKTKLSPEEAPKHIQPWFKKVNPSLKETQRVIFGHWAALDGVTGCRQSVALDTGYIWGGKLSMLKIESDQLFSTPK
jgi:bis(5'-nucleosyl)-tetraphosphatase (symmetrical)